MTTSAADDIATVLVVEDDQGVRESLAMVLEFQKYRVLQSVTGEEGVAIAAEEQPDLIVLDLNLPGIDGVEVCRRVRSGNKAIAILMLTARDEISERVRGLDAGADDYLPKPFALDELLARIRALLRSTGVQSGVEPSTTVSFDDLTIDLAGRRVTRGDASIVLTKIEFDLLELLVRNAGVVMARDVIHEAIWSYDESLGSNSLEVFISALRRKTEADDQSRLIHTVRGVGYVVRHEA